MKLAIYLLLFLVPTLDMRSAKVPQPLSDIAEAISERFSQAPDYAAQASQTHTYTLKGKVVNSVTNEPIRNALVAFYFDAQRFALTGADGVFQFHDLSHTGQGSIAARKPGYFSPQDVRTAQHSMSEIPRPVTVMPDQPPIVLKLIPEGVISGRISGDSGEPIESLPVHLLVQSVESGKWIRQELGFANTNEEGEFRLAGLTAGKYFLFVGPGEAEPSVTQPHQQSFQGYPAVFYSGATDFASASPIDITPGERAEINLTLSLQPFYRVSGTVSGHPFAEGISLEFLNSTGQPIGGMSDFDPNKGTFRTQPLPPGSYTIVARAQDSTNQRIFFASRSLHLNSDLSDVHLTLLPGLTIPVSVHVDVTHSESTVEQGQGFTRFVRGNTTYTSFGDNAQARVVLTPKDPLEQTQYNSERVAGADDQSLAIMNVPPGAYATEIDPNGPYYTQSARSGPTDLLREELTVPPSGTGQPIQVVLRDDFASLAGKVSYNAQVESAIVLVISEDAPRRSQQVVVSQPGGAFHLQRLAPGPYKVLAVDRLENFAYADPEVLRKYLSQARDITLLPDQKANVELELTRVGE
jgi:hypothetical protein